jgi:hypothetical protein
MITPLGGFDNDQIREVISVVQTSRWASVCPLDESGDRQWPG